MHGKRALVLAIFLLCGCGGGSAPVKNTMNYGQIENTREFGVVISQSESKSTGTLGSDNVTGAVLGGAGSVATSSSGPSSTVTVENIDSVHYTIRKDDGQVITIDQTPDLDEPILYPGQRVMIQKNGQYTRLYPENVESH